MHELSLVEALLNEVARRSEVYPGAVVKRVEVSLGEGSGVEADLFSSAFEQLRSGTVCDEAVLALRPVPVAWRCLRCERELLPGAPLSCDACGGPGQLVSGAELLLDRIELEVAHV